MQSAHDHNPSSCAVLAGYVLFGDVSLAPAFSVLKRRRAGTAHIKGDMRAAKGELRACLKTLAAMEVISPVVDEAGTLLAFLPSTGFRNRNSDGMVEHTAIVRELVQILDEATEALTGVGNPPSHRKETAHACGQNFRCQNNATPENSKERSFRKLDDPIA